MPSITGISYGLFDLGWRARVTDADWGMLLSYSGAAEVLRLVLKSDRFKLRWLVAMRDEAELMHGLVGILTAFVIRALVEVIVSVMTRQDANHSITHFVKLVALHVGSIAERGSDHCLVHLLRAAWLSTKFFAHSVAL